MLQGKQEIIHSRTSCIFLRSPEDDEHIEDLKL